jgi:hypothetical protein
MGACKASRSDMTIAQQNIPTLNTQNLTVLHTEPCGWSDVFLHHIPEARFQISVWRVVILTYFYVANGSIRPQIMT